jgi:UPF0716 family protein affecting phage T7 exclusion
MINVAKWALLTLLALPFLELAVFIVAAATIGFGWALSLVLIGSAAGLLILRRATGGHITRMRVDLIMTAGILLLIPGFITDIVALCLLIPPLRQAMRLALGRAVGPARNNGVVDLAPEQWHQVPDPSLPERREH